MSQSDTTTISTSIPEAIGSANIHRAAGILRRVKILGRESTNGRTYTPEAMQQAARLYEGIKVNLDHAADFSPPDRSIADRLGVLRNVIVESDGVYGDLHLLMAHPLAAMVMEAAEKMPETLGLSHNAEGGVRRENGVAIVESIHQVHSVDLVQTPASVAGLFESQQPTGDTSNSVRLQEQLCSEVAELRKLVEQLQQQANISEATARIESAGLEATESRVRSLLQRPTESDRQALLESWGDSVSFGDRPERSPSILDSAADHYSATDGASLARQLR